ncbi:hypothetical protein ROHU_016700 [Labeo rohita]|uniref:Uncharacterized protein n=1 Tax=Labeo rohita TaxID=84645 RepID=A0A498NJF5_LABRO|nr:hypothetical protein ROHU_016700 [Labeo rohita]
MNPHSLSSATDLFSTPGFNPTAVVSPFSPAQPRTTGIPNVSQQATNSPAWNTTLRSTHKEREGEGESEKFKENKSGRKEEEEKMQITEKAPFVC